jgi:hypothetical protein
MKNSEKLPRPYTRVPIKPKQTHKIATRYDRKKLDKHNYD